MNSEEYLKAPQGAERTRKFNELQRGIVHARQRMSDPLDDGPAW